MVKRKRLISHNFYQQNGMILFSLFLQNKMLTEIYQMGYMCAAVDQKQSTDCKLVFKRMGINQQRQDVHPKLD